MGFVEPLKRAAAVLPAAAASCAARIESGRVALVVLIDYPGFNMRVAAAAAAAGVPVLYYITPQVWAWRARRGSRRSRAP